MMSVKKPTVFVAVVALLVASGLLLHCGTAGVAESAGAKAPNTSPADKGAKGAAGVDTIAMAGDLAAWGRDNNNPAALAVAAQVLKSVPTQAMKADAAKKQTEGPKAPDAKKKEAEATPESLLAEAKKMCGTDAARQQAVATIAKMTPAKTRGGTRGPGKHKDMVKPTSTDVYTITFRGGEVAEVGVKGDGDTDLDLFVYDENGNLIVSDTDKSDRCYVRWTPKWTGPFKIKIKNVGRVPNSYILMTN